MTLRRQLTSALAWAGLAIVIAIPAADMVSSKLIPSGSATTVTPAPSVTQVETKDVTPTKPSIAVVEPKAPASTPAMVATASQAAEKPAEPLAANPVKDYLATGKPLPDYITGPDASPADERASTPQATSPWPVAGAPAAADIASVQANPPAPAIPAEPDPIGANSEIATTPVAAPLPLPASARPRPAPEPVVVPPIATRPTVTAPTTIQPVVTEADLKDWKTGTLEDYLRQHRLLSDAQSADAGTGSPAETSGSGQ